MQKTSIILFVILVLAIFFRSYQIKDIPPLHTDEVAFGYNAYSMLLTGKDESGKKFPLGLTSFNDFRPPLYAYITIPFIKVFGLNSLAIRSPSLIFSLLSIILIYILAYLLSRNQEISLYVAILVAFSFWDIQLAREASEKVVAQAFFLLGLISLLLFFKRQLVAFLALAIISWLLAINTYYAPRFIIPLMIPAFFIFFPKATSFFKTKIFLAFVSVFFFVLVLVTFFLPGSTNRLSELNIFTHPEVKLKLEEQIREDGSEGNILLTRAFHNKIAAFSLAFFKNYSAYFNADYLFLNGGLPSRVKVPETGLLPLIQFPFLLLGLWVIFRKRLGWGLFTVFWLLVVPIPAAFTFDETPNIYRTYSMLPALAIITGVGIWYFRKLLKQHTRLLGMITFVMGLFFIWNFLYFWHQYFVHYQVHQPWYRDYAYKELVAEVNKLEENYHRVVMTKGQGAPYLFFLFYSQYDPQRYQEEGSPKDEPFRGFGKYIFHPQDCPLSAGKTGEEEVNGEEGVLYVNKGNCVTPLYNARLLKTIRWKDNSLAFKILEYVSTASGRLK